MAKVDYRLALENAHKSLAQDEFFRRLSKMGPEEQSEFLKKLSVPDDAVIEVGEES